MIRFRFVQDNQTELLVKPMCELVEVPRSSFYAWRNRAPSARDIADDVLLVVIGDIYAGRVTPMGCRVCTASCAAAGTASPGRG